MSSNMPPITRKPRFVVARDGKLEPLSNADTRADADDRIEREITEGLVKEVDLYIYVGTVRPKVIAEVLDAFAHRPGDELEPKK